MNSEWRVLFPLVVFPETQLPRAKRHFLRNHSMPPQQGAVCLCVHPYVCVHVLVGEGKFTGSVGVSSSPQTSRQTRHRASRAFFVLVLPHPALLGVCFEIPSTATHAPSL